MPGGLSRSPPRTPRRQGDFLLVSKTHSPMSWIEKGKQRAEPEDWQSTSDVQSERSRSVSLLLLLLQENSKQLDFASSKLHLQSLSNAVTSIDTADLCLHQALLQGQVDTSLLIKVRDPQGLIHLWLDIYTITPLQSQLDH